MPDPSDVAYDRVLAAAAARQEDCPPPPRPAGMARLLDWAQATGRILASSRARWEANWRRDPSTTEAYMRILTRFPEFASAPGAVHVRAAGPSYAASQTVSGLDVSALPPRLRSVAARCDDRGTVFRLIEQYGGDAAEPDPWVLQLEGFDDVAADVQAAISEERTAEHHAFTESVKAANDAHVAAMNKEHDRRRQGLL